MQMAMPDGLSVVLIRTPSVMLVPVSVLVIQPQAMILANLISQLPVQQ